MPTFNYEAVDVHGAAHAGEIQCDTRVAALESLQVRGLTPLSLASGTDAGAMPVLPRLHSMKLTRSSGVSAAQLVSITQSLAALLQAGLTIERALSITANLQERAQAHSILAELGKAVRWGRSFADALSESTLPLPPYYIGLIRAGEAGGSLAQTLARLAELLRRQREVRERIRSALIYPALLAVVVVVTIVLLVTFVLPRFQTLFAESDAPLPWSTRAVLAVGAFVSSYWWLLASAVIGMACGFIAYVRTARGRRRVDAWLLRSRLTFGLPLAVESARLLRTLGTLLANGVPIGSAMRIARASLGNSVLQEALDDAARRVKAGASTSAALQAAAVFPAHAIQLARVGEEPGRLEALLVEAAAILESESSSKLERLLALAVPALTMLMGLLIAALIGSVLVGLLSVNDLAL